MCVCVVRNKSSPRDRKEKLHIKRDQGLLAKILQMPRWEFSTSHNLTPLFVSSSFTSFSSRSCPGNHMWPSHWFQSSTALITNVHIKKKESNILISNSHSVWRLHYSTSTVHVLKSLWSHSHWMKHTLENRQFYHDLIRTRTYMWNIKVVDLK